MMILLKSFIYKQHQYFPYSKSKINQFPKIKQLTYLLLERIKQSGYQSFLLIKIQAQFLHFDYNIKIAGIKYIMHFDKDNYLQIKYQSKKGLVLNWNFTDLHQIQNYYHHLFIIANPRSKSVQNLIEHYYKRMKFGDYIGIVFYHDSKGPKSMNWVQKSQLSSLQLTKIFNSITKTHLPPEKVDQLFRYAANITVQYSNSNVVSNFILSQEYKQKGDNLIQKIKNLRQQGAFLYHCTFFNINQFNKICFNNGIHFLNTDSLDFLQVISFYHSIINNAAVRMAKVIIQCHNGQMMSYDAQIWQNSEFNRIERAFYGPSINYEEDIIQFHILDTCQDTEFDMVITLELALFSGQTINGSKKIKLSFPNERFFDKSLNLAVFQPLITLNGIEIKCNPYSSSTFVRLMKSVYQDVGQLKEKLESIVKERRTREQKVQKVQKQQKNNTKMRKRPVQYFIPHKEQQGQQFSA